MCDMTAYSVKDSQEQQLMSSVTRLVATGGEVEMTSIFGDKKKVSGSIIEVDFDSNKVVIAAI